MRFSDPNTLETNPEDYLPGLLCPDPVAACTLLAFILESFGPTALKSVLIFLKQQHKPLPWIMLKQLWAFCEEYLKGLDIKWGLMRLQRDRARSTDETSHAGKQLELDFMASLVGAKYNRSSSLPTSIRENPKPTEINDTIPDNLKTAIAKNVTGKAAHRTVEKRFSEIRSFRTRNNIEETKPCHT